MAPPTVLRLAKTHWFQPLVPADQKHAGMRLGGIYGD
jgi:hypothetical protein